ncbi:unnamed protein product [Cunninghamella blakesleeana]
MFNRTIFLKKNWFINNNKTIWIQYAKLSTFQPGDFCILRHLKTNRKYFIGPLEQEGYRHVKGGTIFHKQLLGTPVRTIIKTNQESRGYMAHFPTLDEYVINVPRACTPIYPKDACTIVQLLDVAPGHRILEAGTGNGSLTLHLARAISGDGKIDTVDMRETHSMTAQKHIKRFERGRYQSLIHFYIGKLSDILQQQKILQNNDVNDDDDQQQQQSYLKEKNEIYDGVVLDLPDPSEELTSILPFLKNDRFIVCYLPNMTQVLHLMETIQRLPLVMEDCIEAEWKEWEIRPTFIRQFNQNINKEDPNIDNNDNNDHDTFNRPEMNNNNEDDNDNNRENKKMIHLNESKTWVCRPKNYDVRGHTAFLVKLRKCCSVDSYNIE